MLRNGGGGGEVQLVRKAPTKITSLECVCSLWDAITEEFSAKILPSIGEKLHDFTS